MNVCKFYVVVSLVALSGCANFTPKTVEPSEGPTARVRVIGGSGDLVVTPAAQPGSEQGAFVAHSFLYPGARQKLGMPESDSPTRSADEYYVKGDQDVRVSFNYGVTLPGDKFATSRREACGPIDGQFRAVAGQDYEVSASVDPQGHGCTIKVTSIVATDGHAVAYEPVTLSPRELR